jgi:LysR family hydrogen peroxide-inducible transcriptional activator
VAQARATLAAVAGVTAAADAARDPFAGELRLGVITTVAPYLLPIALPELAQALPRTPLYLVEDLTDRLLARLRDGALDTAVIATDPREAKLAAIELYDEPFFLVSSGHCGKRGRASISVEEIDPSTLLLLAEGHCLRDQALALAMRPKGPRSARTCAGRASRRCVILPRPDRGRRSRPSSLTPTGAARAPGSRA